MNVIKILRDSNIKDEEYKNTSIIQFIKIIIKIIVSMKELFGNSKIQFFQLDENKFPKIIKTRRESVKSIITYILAYLIINDKDT